MKRQINWQYWIPPQCGVTVLGMGEPGIGKTASMESLSKKCGRELHSWILSQCLPEDVGGLMVLGDEGGVPVFRKALHEAMVRSQKVPSVVFFDELTNTARSTQGAALEVIHNPPENAWFFAAANPLECATNPIPLSSAMRNRLCMVEYEPDFVGILNAFDSDAVGMNQIPFADTCGAEFPIVPQGWQQFRPFWSNSIARFLRTNPKNMHCKPADEDEQVAWASPRSWANAANVLAGCDAVGAGMEVALKCVQGCVGVNVGWAFMDFVEKEKLPDAMEVLNDVTWKVPPEGGVALAIFRNVTALVKGRIESAGAPALAGNWWERYRQFSLRVFAQRREYGMMLYGITAKLRPGGYVQEEMSEVEQEILKLLTPKA